MTTDHWTPDRRSTTSQGRRSGPHPGILQTPYLCCGSTTFDLESILRYGLRPLDQGEEGKAQYSGRPGWIGLTRANAFHYAVSQCLHGFTPHCHSGLPRPDPVIFEIDTTFLDPEALYPDELYLGWASGEAENQDRPPRVPPPVSMSLARARREWVRSMEHLGLVSYKGTILAQSITRYAVVSYKKCPNLTELASCSSFNGEEFPTSRHELVSLTNHLFDATPLMDDSWWHESYDSLKAEYEELREAAGGDRHAKAKLPLVADRLKAIRDARAMTAKCERERATGVQVVDLRP